MAPTQLTFGHASHVGLRRTDNQDAWGIFPPEEGGTATTRGRIFVVADGMGGHLGGREASGTAVEAIEATFFAPAGGAGGDVPERLRQAFEVANRRIYERAHNDPALYGMGTTCTALALEADRAWIAHVGDSRAYRIAENDIRQLTDDHTRVGEMVRRHLLSEEEAASHPSRNILNRAMGVHPEVEVDLFETEPLRPGEAVLLCSDGLTGVPLDAIRATVLAHAPPEACRQLVQMANDRGGHDNVTVVIVRAAEEAPPKRRPRWSGVLLLLLLLALAFVLTA